MLAPHRDRITWDAPIHAIADIEALPFAPKMVNVKPSRFGGLARLCAGYDYCAEHGIGAYGGGQFELGPGRGQAQLPRLAVPPGHAERPRAGRLQPDSEPPERAAGQPARAATVGDRLPLGRLTRGRDGAAAGLRPACRCRVACAASACPAPARAARAPRRPPARATRSRACSASQAARTAARNAACCCRARARSTRSACASRSTSCGSTARAGSCASIGRASVARSQLPRRPGRGGAAVGRRSVVFG